MKKLKICWRVIKKLSSIILPFRWDLWPLVSSLLAFFLYFGTLLPTVGFWDTGEFNTVLYTVDIPHPTGYPTYLLLGKIFLTLFPFGSVAYRTNLLSAIFVAGGLFFVLKIFLALTGNKVISFLATGLMATTPVLWPLALRADPHALHFFFFTLALYLFILFLKTSAPVYLYLLVFSWGLALGNHLLAAFFLPLVLVALGVFLFKKEKPKLIFRSLSLVMILLLVSLSAYLILPIIFKLKGAFTTVNRFDSLGGIAYHVLGVGDRPFSGQWLGGGFLSALSFYYHLLSDYLFLPLIIFSFLGLGLLFWQKPLLALAITLVFFLSTYFSLRYPNADIERYFVVSLALQTIWLGYGLVRAYSFLSRKNWKWWRRGFFFLVLVFLVFNVVRNLVNQYPKANRRHDYSAANFAQGIFKTVEKNGVIFSWWSYTTPLWYFQKIEGLRPDITIINAGKPEWVQLLPRFIRTRPVYFLEPVTDLPREYKQEKAGSLYQIVPSTNPPSRIY